jgi:hypothetical protein
LESDDVFAEYAAFLDVIVLDFACDFLVVHFAGYFFHGFGPNSFAFLRLW